MLIHLIFLIAGGLITWMLIKLLRQRPENPVTGIPAAEQLPATNVQASEEELTRLRTKIDNLYLVNELSRNVTASLSIHETFRHLYQVVNSMMDAAVMELDVRYGASEERVFLTNLKAPANDPEYINPFSEWCFLNNRSVLLNDAEADYARYVYNPLQLPDGRAARSVMSFPVSSGQELIAAFTVISMNKNAFDDFHFEMVGHLIPFIASSIKNAYHHRELNQLKQRAEKSEDFMKQFLANMSHEIRTPIHAITGMTRLLLEKSPRDEQVRYLKNISRASETLLTLINDILDLSKIEANRLEIEQIEFSLTDTLFHVRNMMQFKAEEKGVLLDIKPDPLIAPVLLGDPVRITQVLINLIGNAIKFTESGKVTVSVDLYRDPNRHTPNEDPGINELFFSVTDTGIGMTEEHLRKIFQKYTQAHASISRKYGGTGLGLSIARQLVELMGGKLGASSKEGEGSSFYFNLKFPVGRSAALLIPDPSDVVVSGIAALEGKRVLIVDDNEYNRIVAKESLEAKIRDIKIDEVPGGQEALAMVNQIHYDIILMDLVMKNMDGFETTERIRAHFDTAAYRTPVLALSASVSRDVIEKCAAAGIDQVLAKPFRTEELIKAMITLLLPSGNPATHHNEAGRMDKVKRLVDLRYLLDYFDQDSERVIRHLSRFQKQAPASLRSLRSFIANSEFEDARIVAHSLKPLLAVLGPAGLHESAAALEQQLIKGSSLQEIEPLLEELTYTCLQAQEEVAEILKEQKHLL